MPKQRQDNYQLITNTIIGLIETHGANWTKPWSGSGGSGKRPISVSTGKPYKGCNPLLLWAAGFNDHRWGTYNAWKEKGCQVRAGEKGTKITFFKVIEKKDPNSGEGEISSQDATIPFLRVTSVFNAEQVEGAEPLPAPEAPESAAEADERVEAAIAFAKATGADIRITEGSDSAFYKPTADYIVVPAISDFIGTSTSSPQEAFAGTLLHELGHWTGHRSRLNRPLLNSFGSEDYAKEELVAELAATFLCSDLGISAEPRPDHAQYLASWLKALKNDKRLIVRASSQAHKAVDFVHGLQPKEDAAEKAA